MTYIGKLRGINLASSTATLIAKRGEEFDSFSMHDAAINKDMEIHEENVEREAQRLFSVNPPIQALYTPLPNSSGLAKSRASLWPSYRLRTGWPIPP
jgi:hypothetical protein